MEYFLEVAMWNFTKLKMKVVKLSLQEKFVLEFESCPLSAHRLLTDGLVPKNEF